MARLRQHQELEFDARRRDDRRAVVRLSGEFHVLIAELAGNSALARSMRELSTLTCLIIFLYDSSTANSCQLPPEGPPLKAANEVSGTVFGAGGGQASGTPIGLKFDGW